MLILQIFVFTNLSKLRVNFNLLLSYNRKKVIQIKIQVYKSAIVFLKTLK